MSAEVLREAAAEIRRDTFNGQTEDAAFMEAVADWLEFSAFTFESRQEAYQQGIGMVTPAANPYAVAAARAYLDAP